MDATLTRVFAGAASLALSMASCGSHDQTPLLLEAAHIDGGVQWKLSNRSAAGVCLAVALPRVYLANLDNPRYSEDVYFVSTDEKGARLRKVRPEWDAGDQALAEANGTTRLPVGWVYVPPRGEYARWVDVLMVGGNRAALLNEGPLHLDVEVYHPCNRHRLFPRSTPSDQDVREPDPDAGGEFQILTATVGRSL